MLFQRHNLRVLASMACVAGFLAVASCAKDEDLAASLAALPQPAPTVAAKPIDLKAVCEKVKDYSPAEIKALADAVIRLDKNSPIIPAMGDYKRMRDEARACLRGASSP